VTTKRPNVYLFYPDSGTYTLRRKGGPPHVSVGSKHRNLIDDNDHGDPPGRRRPVPLMTQHDTAPSINERFITLFPAMKRSPSDIWQRLSNPRGRGQGPHIRRCTLDPRVERSASELELHLNSDLWPENTLDWVNLDNHRRPPPPSCWKPNVVAPSKLTFIGEGFR
jgi:hypothetical protein